MTYEPAQGVIANPDLLSEDYVPPRIPAREPQMEGLRQFLLRLCRPAFVQFHTIKHTI